MNEELKTEKEDEKDGKGSENSLPPEKEVKEDFEEQSPLLREEVIERKNDIVLEAQAQPQIEPENTKSTTSFGKPTLNVAEAINEKGVAENQEEKNLSENGNAKIENNEQQDSSETRKEEQFEETKTEPIDDLPKMKGEKLNDGEKGTTMKDIQKKAGQTTAKWSWTLFENAGPKLQLFLTELDEGEFRKYVLEDKLPEEALEFAKNYNDSLAEEFSVKDWEKELIYPPLEEMLEQAGMNASMSPGVRFGLGVSVVLGARAIQTKKYRSERDELVKNLLSSYSKSRKEMNKEDTSTEKDDGEEGM